MTQPPEVRRYRGFLAHTARAAYATVVVTAAIAAEAAVLEDWGSWHFLGTLFLTLAVLFFAEVYSEVLGDEANLSFRQRMRSATNEHWAVFEAGIPLAVPLVLGGLGVISTETAVWGVLVVAVLALGLWGGLAAANRDRPASRIALAVTASMLIGVVIILLKAIKF